MLEGKKELINLSKNVCEAVGCNSKAKIKLTLRVGLKGRILYLYAKAAYQSFRLTGIINTRCSAVGEYDDLLDEAKSKAAAYMSTAKVYIPKMYNALMSENKNISPQDARDRIEKDCVGIWSRRTILDALPDEAKNQEKRKSGRLGQKKRSSAAFSAAPEAGAVPIILDTNGRPISG